MNNNLKKIYSFFMILFGCLLVTSCGAQTAISSSRSNNSSSNKNSSSTSSSSTNSNNNNIAERPKGISTFDDGHESTANWIWADADVKEGQWVALRKTFYVDKVPTDCIARISADTKYWLWINGELAIFEGQLKLGNSIDTWFYDREDISQYLVKGENTIAVQVFYSGKTSSSTINSGVPSFLLETETPEVNLFTDTSWKAVLDPAYEEPISLNNNRNGEANIKYNAASSMVDENGNKWTDKDYDDSSWDYAVNQDDSILHNRIYNDTGGISEVYYKNTDPRLNLVLRSIPQLKLDDVTKFTSTGSNGNGKWTKASQNYSFAPLSLPDTYTLEAEVVVAEPLQYISNQPIGAAIGFCVCVSDSNNFYMPQINFCQGTDFDGVRYKPHVKNNGGWSLSSYDITDSDVGRSLYLPGSYDYRYNTKHTVKIEVTPQKITTYLNDYLLGTMNNTVLARKGSTIGIRQDINEMLNIYSLKVTDINNKELYNANIDSLEDGDSISRMSLLAKENTNFTSPYNTVEKDLNGDAYIPVRNCCTAINDGLSYSTYKIVNETNIQGTPYLKVKSTTGGELISIKSDTWVNGNSTSIAHQYITKTGEQSWEALGWMNGYEITFTIPDSVEVLELGFRKSGYNTEATGLVVTDNEILNQLHKEAYDTLYVCMRDSFMDCPDRERAQWLGDAVINMQQAAYTMDENAALLYKKTLTQAIGFLKPDGAIPSMIALGNPNLELPMQSLAGVHSFWQYYMYYGDEDLLVEAYPVLLDYLKLWNISANGIITHRAGTWDWFDWGENHDTVVIENCWYYVALKTVLNIAELDSVDSTKEDLEFIENRMNLIQKHFDTNFWDSGRNAYYRATNNGSADDRANAMAIYSGLAKTNRHEGILNVLVNTYNASPYMEKYVLESMYMLGADEEAVTRTLNRFGPFTKDGYPTLPEIWLDQTLFNGDETKNHAWTGAPLSLLYMYNAGITPLSPSFESVQIRPQLGTLNSVSATMERAFGKIQVEVNKGVNECSLNVSLPSGSLGGVIYVPRANGNNTMVKLNGTIVFANGAPINDNLPTGVTYFGEDDEYVAFKVSAGTYSFVSQEDSINRSNRYKIINNSINDASSESKTKKIERRLRKK